jgi:hypothetical protein
MNSTSKHIIFIIKEKVLSTPIQNQKLLFPDHRVLWVTFRNFSEKHLKATLFRGALPYRKWCQH